MEIDIDIAIVEGTPAPISKFHDIDSDIDGLVILSRPAGSPMDRRDKLPA